MPLLMAGGFFARGETSMGAEHGSNVLSDKRSARYIGATDVSGRHSLLRCRPGIQKAIQSHGFAGSQLEPEQGGPCAADASQHPPPHSPGVEYRYPHPAQEPTPPRARHMCSKPEKTRRLNTAERRRGA